MSRHRIVRSIKYEDEYYDEEDDYSRSVEDKYCISPSTAEQFTWNREKNVNFVAYMGSEPVIDEEGEEYEASVAQGRSSSSSSRLALSEADQAILNSCLDEIRNVLGETVSEAAMADVILQNQFNTEAALNQLLLQDAPKAQREPKQRRNRSQASAVPASDFNPLVQDSSWSVSKNESGENIQPTPVVAATSAVTKSSAITPSKSLSSAKVTIGFELPKPFPPVSPAVSKKSGNKVKIPSNTYVPSNCNKTNVNTVQSKDSGKPSSSTNPSDSNSAVDRLKAGEEKGVAGADASLRNAVEFMGLDGDKDVIQASVDAMKPCQATPKSKGKASKVDVMAEYAKRNEQKELLNLVVIGHVDAGKSTLMGHLLYQLGMVNKKTMHKYEQESKKLGKSSFAFAWVLDETEEERTRGVTMDVAQTRFETDKKSITLLDAPGHKDFIPNMITGAAQADVAILVINATRGEFETGFDAGGQTREHALLARSLGVGQIVVAVNKMDTVDWSQERYNIITKKIGQFLSRQAGFKEADVTYVPCSGLSGENLVKPALEPQLTQWYQPATTLMEQIEKLQPPSRPVDKPFRLNVSDVYKGVGSGFNTAGRIGSGYIQQGEKVLIMPAGVLGNIKNVYIDDGPATLAFAGDHVNLTLSGVDMANVNIGSCLCDPKSPVKSATRIRAKIVLFALEFPITKGFPVVFHYQSINEPAVIKRLISQINRSTGEVIKKKPRCLVKNSSAVVEIELERALCLELYTDYKDLGRFMLRHAGHTIAAGLVEDVLQTKTPLNGSAHS